MLFPYQDIPAKFVIDMLVLSRSDQLVLPGRSGGNLFKGSPNSDMLALFIDFSGQGASAY